MDHTAEDMAADNDAAWFRANPSRSVRLRPAFPGEILRNELGETMVLQINPGVRWRTALPLGAAAWSGDTLVTWAFENIPEKVRHLLLELAGH